jgi:hypothetical protein
MEPCRLVALPSTINFPRSDRTSRQRLILAYWVEATADLGLLTLAEMFHALPEQPAYADNCW